jgi:polyphenol oxidase
MEPFQLWAEDGQPLAQLLRLHSWSEQEGLTTGFTTRNALNMALHVGDEPANVVRNRSAVMNWLEWPLEAFTSAEQVHGNHVHVVTRDDIGRGRLERTDAIPDSDALITNEPDVLLTMFFADCVPLYFYDPTTQCIGLAHAGWKGTVSEVAVKTVEKMQQEYGANPSDIRAAIGPSIGADCYEVDEYVLQKVRPLLDTFRTNSPSEDLDRILISSESDGRAFLDLKHLNRQLMIRAGILPSRIEMTSWCTGCRTDLLFSHRMENGKTGRMMSWLGRKSR